MVSTGPAYSLTIRCEYDNSPGMLGKITTCVGECGGNMAGIDVITATDKKMVRDLTVYASGIEHGQDIIEAVAKIEGVVIRSVSDATFLFHLGGKIEMRSKVPAKTREDMSKAYTPGVARVCMAIYEDPEAVWALTGKANTVAVVTDGSAVLGLGDIGPKAAMPVMEGKALLFKELSGVDAWPICLDTQDVDEIVTIVKAIAPGFGGINLEDISAPRCFEIEERLKAELDIPVFHDDQHGTAVVMLAGLINALAVTGRQPENIKVVLLGVGASGTACAKMMMIHGVKNIIGFDRQGALTHDRDYSDNRFKKWFADNTNPNNEGGSLQEVLKGADVFLGLSGPGLVTKEDIAGMADDAIVFALANPTPEIAPEELPDNVKVMATGRSDYPNQINNSLGFPGLFRGIFDVRASEINDQMKLAAARALASVIPEESLGPDFVIPSVFDANVVTRVAAATAQAAIDSGVARRTSRSDDGASYASFRQR
ncbi:MAG: NAD-dependent malic enzyme [Chloroflexi bacterium]|nr:NAD-dependent malic enzyme [Chloroflexota bacterium]